MESSGNLLAKLTALIHRQPECPDKGFFTAAEWAKKWNTHERRARRLLDAGVDAGLMESRKYNTKLRNISRPVLHYKEVGGKK